MHSSETTPVRAVMCCNDCNESWEVRVVQEPTADGGWSVVEGDATCQCGSEDVYILEVD